MLRLAAILVFAVVLTVAPAHAGEYVVETGSKITYYVSHPTHNVVGVSTRPRGTLVYDPAMPEDFAGLAGKAIQVEWSSFDSGNASRDSNTRSAVGAVNYPTLTLVPEAVEGAVKTGNEVSGTLKARLYVNGVKRPVTAPVKVDISDPKAIKAAAKFTIKMTDFNIEPPSLLFVATENEVVIEAALVLAPK